MARACPHLSAAEAAAYDAPYPDSTYKAGVRRFPNLVPEFPNSPGAAIERAARDFWRNEWRGESVMAIGMTDPVLGPPVMRALHKDIRGCPPPLEFAEAGHFVQEWGEQVAPAVLSRCGVKRRDAEMNWAKSCHRRRSIVGPVSRARLPNRISRGVAHSVCAGGSARSGSFAGSAE